MTNDELMTPGQMRQLMNSVGSTIPADLSQAEVQRILKGPRMRRYLETFWDAMRTDEEKGLYVRLPQGDIVEYLYEQQLAWDDFRTVWSSRENEQALRSKLEPFHYTGNRSRHGSWMTMLTFEDESPAGIHRWLQRNGYRTADFRELVAYSMYNRPRPGNQFYKIIASEGCNDYDGTGGMAAWFNNDNCRLEFFFMEGVGAEGYDKEWFFHAEVPAVRL